ncbi:Gfo/Idh/MocA family oxidoreductase, partial [Candidatus Fermentibacterales bacterium]|nr:Gfo/Idh/MocA family oxidoreductase [Candidatus Fermentibacterales bacterium]
REDYYRKEISFRVSCSYGPGRYDPDYEEEGRDYPLPFVRWTEGRNMEAVLDLMASGSLRPLDLVTHRFEFEDSPAAYEMIASGSEPYCGMLLDYPGEDRVRRAAVDLGSAPRSRTEGSIGLSVAGAGSFAQSFLLPELGRLGRVDRRLVTTASGVTAGDVGRRFGFAGAVDSFDAIIEDEPTTAVLIATRHDMHAGLVERALRAGRHVFVEKPLCIREEELRSIAACIRELAASGPLPVLQVGFNRRFSPAARKLRSHFGDDPCPLMMHYRVNAGRIPREHWTQSPEHGGGRIVGEACHFIDLMQFVCGSDPVSVCAQAIRTGDSSVPLQDNVSIQLSFGNGSVGTIHYFSEGARAMPKEMLEVSGRGTSAVIDNFRTLEVYGSRKSGRIRAAGKGFGEELEAFGRAMRTGEPAIAIESQLITTLSTFRALESIESGKVLPVDIRDLYPEEEEVP